MEKENQTILVICIVSMMLIMSMMFNLFLGLAVIGFQDIAEEYSDQVYEYYDLAKEYCEYGNDLILYINQVHVIMQYDTDVLEHMDC